MATEKTIKIQKNKILTYSVNKAGFKTVYGSTIVSENQTINVEMKNLSSETGAFQLGDRLFGISSFVDYFTPSGTYDVDSLKYISVTQTTGTGLTNIAVVKETWISKVETELGIETPKGSSNTFVFTYDGVNWNLTGTATQSNVDLEDYGISFDGTATEGNVITVVETQYNRFAFFVLDANYRGENYKWTTANDDLSNYVTNYPSSASPSGYTELSSATYYDFVINNYFNIQNYPAFNYCKNIGTFILPNGIKIKPLLPNTQEIRSIYDNRTTLDSIDPVVVADPSVAFNLTNWTFSYDGANTCVIVTGPNTVNCLLTDGSWSYIPSYNVYGVSRDRNEGVVPVFEVPVM